MTATERVAALAGFVTDALGITCYTEPGAPGRGDVFAFVDAPTFTYEPSARTYCPGSRPSRLRASVVIVSTGSDPGHLAALLDLADRFASEAGAADGWTPAGDAVPATFADVSPAYTFPMITT